MMLDATDTDTAPWYIVQSDEESAPQVYLAPPEADFLIKPVPRGKVKRPKRSAKGAYDDEATLTGRRFVPENY
jgi:polyphosphate kinase